MPSVRVLAENAPPEATSVLIVLDAKREQIYTARFERALTGGEWVEREPARLDGLGDVVGRASRPLWLLGEGIPYHQKFLPAGDPGVHVTAEESWRPRAAAVAMIGMAMAARGEYADAARLTPIYIRRPEAEEKWDQLHPPAAPAGR